MKDREDRALWFGTIFGTMIGAFFSWAATDSYLNSKWRNKIYDSQAEIQAIRAEVGAIREREKVEKESAERLQR